MGLLRRKEICCICHDRDGKYESKDGLVCQNCFSKCGRFVPVFGFSLLKGFHKEDIINFINQNEEALKREEIFRPTLEIDEFAKFDDVNHLWMVNENSASHMKVNSIVWSFHNFDSLDLIEDGNDVIQGSLSGALVGGALFGGVGAVVGSSVGKKTIKKEIKKLEIKINLKESSMSEVKIILIQSPVKSDSALYNKMYDIANQIVKKFAEIQSMNESPIKKRGILPVDEIMKLKELLDIGAITQEEYDSKKMQLLNL